MTKLVNSLRILATTDSGLLSWQRSARMAVTKAADEIERLQIELDDLKTKQETMSKELLTNRKIYEG